MPLGLYIYLVVGGYHRSVCLVGISADTYYYVVHTLRTDFSHKIRALDHGRGLTLELIIGNHLTTLLLLPMALLFGFIPKLSFIH